MTTLKIEHCNAKMLKNKKSCSYSIDKKDYIRINYITITGENKVIYFEDGKLIDSDDYVKNIFVHKKSKIYDILISQSSERHTKGGKHNGRVQS